MLEVVYTCIWYWILIRILCNIHIHYCNIYFFWETYTNSVYSFHYASNSTYNEQSWISQIYSRFLANKVSNQKFRFKYCRRTFRRLYKLYDCFGYKVEQEYTCICYWLRTSFRFFTVSDSVSTSVSFYLFLQSYSYRIRGRAHDISLRWYYT